MESLEISAGTGIYGLIGDPVDHSLSPIIQNAAFSHVGIDAVYVAFLVKKGQLKSAIDGIRVIGIRGFNVTVPHKIKIVRYLDTVERKASEIGSVNTVISREGILKGFNTDVAGALRSVKEERLRGASVLLLGAGGAARAIGHAFAPEIKRMRIVNRTISKARQLANVLCRKYDCDVSSAPLREDRVRDFVESAEIIVNASSMGMRGKNDPPISKNWLHANQIVFDLVYDPPLTTLLRNARSAGAQTIDGSEMLLNQGAKSFELWTDKRAPISKMRRALNDRKMLAYADV